MSASVSTPLLETIEPDDITENAPLPSGRIPSTPRTPVILSPGARPAQETATNPSDAEAGETPLLNFCACTYAEVNGQVLRAYSDKSVHFAALRPEILQLMRING